MYNIVGYVCFFSVFFHMDVPNQTFAVDIWTNTKNKNIHECINGQGKSSQKSGGLKEGKSVHLQHVVPPS